MERKGLLPDVFTYASLVHGHCISSKVSVALKVLDEMKSRDIKGNKVVYTALISSLSKEGRSDKAFRFYDEIMQLGSHQMILYMLLLQEAFTVQLVPKGLQLIFQVISFLFLSLPRLVPILTPCEE
jgi:pentatricopeptide repeat protein